jgi:hypothetical protein
VNVFLNEGPDSTDMTQCTNLDEFNIKPKEVHMLFTDLTQLGLKRVSSPDQPVRFDAVRPCARRCFNVKLKHPDMELVVGAKVSVSMLLKLGFIEFEEFTLTRELWAKVLKDDLKRKTITEMSSQTPPPPDSTVPAKKPRTVLLPTPSRMA